MIRSTRLGAAAGIAVLGVSAATPALASATTTAPTLPDTSQLTTALETLLGTSTTGVANTGSLIQELESLQSAGGSSAATTALTNIDATLATLSSALNNLLGGLLGGLLGSNPLAQSLETTLSSLTNLLPASPSAAQSQALAELQSVFSTAGLSSLLSGLTSDNGAAALSQLAGLQSLLPGASTATGGLTSVGSVLSTLASKLTSGSADASSLTSAANILSSNSAISASQLQTVIADLQSVSSTAASGTAGASIYQVVQGLVSQLSQSGSLLGGLSAVGSGLNSNQVSSYLTQYNSLASSTPGQGYSGLGALLETISQVNGISGTQLGNDLATLAANTSNEDGVVYQNEIDGLNQLEANAANLPEPLKDLVVNLAEALKGSGGLLGNVNMTDANRVSALTELQTLGGLTSGSTISALPGIGSLLTALSTTSPLTGTPVATLLTELSTAISGSSISGANLSGLGTILTDVAGALPAPLSTTIAGLASELTSAGNTVTGKSGSTTTSGTGGTSATGTSSTSSTSSTATGTGSTKSGTSGSTSTGSSATAKRYDWGLVKKVTRTGNALTVTLYCFANSGLKCTNTMKATEVGYHALTKKVTMNAGKTDRFTLKLKPVATAKKATKAKVKKATKRPAIKLSVTSGVYKAAKTLK